MGFGHVEGLFIARQADAVGAVDGEYGLGDKRAIGFGVINPGAILVPMAGLAVISEPKTSILVEHDIIGAAQRMAVTFGVQYIDPAGCHIHPFDAAAGIALILIAGKMFTTLDVPAKAAVVADVAGPVGAHGRAIGPAAGFRHHLHPAIGPNPREGATGDFNQ